MVYFARAPLPGQVKTRLCPPLTTDEAAALYGTFLRRVVRPVPGVRTLVYGWPGEQRAALEAALPAGWQDAGVELRDQCGADLWERMQNCFAELFAEVNANTIVVPQLESVTALENLDEILTVDGIDYFAGGPEDLAQSMGLPGQHDHPKIKEAYDAAAQKIRAAGKVWFDDLTEDANAFFAVKEAVEGLLIKHGRQSQLAL